MHTARRAVVDVLDGRDDRLIAVVGPCSVHDLDATLVYARWLHTVAGELADELVVVMRTYFEKPRTALGWPGLLGDPWLDGGYAMADGVRLARSVLVEIAATGLPTACEWLAPAVPGYLADLVTWGAIGARTVHSPPHRQLASGLPMPVGMKNGTDGAVAPAIDAITAAARPHVYPGLSDRGAAAVVRTTGNPDCHLVLRGGTRPNHGPDDVAAAVASLRAAGLPERLLIDASHGNSGKDHLRQREVAGEIAAQVAAGNRAVVGVLLEGFLEPGRQDIVPGRPLVFGMSITDACMNWRATEDALRELADAVRVRRGGGPRRLMPPTPAVGSGRGGD